MHQLINILLCTCITNTVTTYLIVRNRRKEIEASSGVLKTSTKNDLMMNYVQKPMWQINLVYIVRLQTLLEFRIIGPTIRDRKCLRVQTSLGGQRSTSLRSFLRYCITNWETTIRIHIPTYRYREFEVIRREFENKKECKYCSTSPQTFSNME